jgi:hypothetical protein
MLDGASYLQIYAGDYGYNLDIGQSGFSRFNVSDTGDLLLNHPSGSPTITGGNTDSSGLTLRSTTASGATDFIRMKVGNNGSIEALTVVNSGNVGIGSTTPGSILSVGDTGGINFSTATSSFSGTGGINLASGCFAVRGVCVGSNTSSSGATFAFPFTNTLFGSTNANSTSTLIGFTNGIYSLASSTIGNGNQNGGLTISGGATTTGSVYVGGNIGIGTTTPSQKLELTDGSVSITSASGQGRGLILSSDVIDDTSRPSIKFLRNNFAAFLGDDHTTQTFNFMTALNSTRSFSALVRAYGSETGGFNNYAGLTHDGTDGSVTTGFGDLVLSPATLKVGIGTSSPATELNIAATLPEITLSDTDATTNQKHWFIEGDSGVFSIGTTSDQLVKTASRALSISAAGNIGVGTSTPSAKLDIYNSGGTNAGLFVEGGTSGVTIAQFARRVSSIADLKINASSGDMQMVFSSNNIDGYSMGYDISNTSFNISSGSGVGSNDRLVVKGANVGVGTTSPYATLSVAGQVVGAYFTATTSTSSTFPYASTTALSANTICISTDCRTSWPTGSSGSSFSFPFTQTLFGSTNANSTSTLIGFTNGIYSLASSTIGNGNQNGGLTISGGATTTGNAYFASNVGVGNNAPGYRLDTANGTVRMVQSATGFSAGAYALSLQNDAASTWLEILNNGGANKGIFFGLNGNNFEQWNYQGGDILFYTSTNQSSGNERLRIKNDGNVGIGTSSPYAALSVAGASGILANVYSATSTTATSTFAGGLNIGSGNLVYDLNSGVTSALALQTGNLNFENDAGLVSWTDLQLTSAAPNDTPQGYTAFLNGSSTISVYGLSNGNGYLQADYPRVAIGSTTVPTSKLTVFANGSSNNGVFEALNSNNISLMRVLDNGLVGISTSTPNWMLQIASTTASATMKGQLALTDMAAQTNLKHWVFSSNNGSLFIATSSDSLATSTISAITINKNGFFGLGTTSPSSILSVGNTGGINFSTATSSFSTTGGISLASGCFAIAGTCLSTSGGAGGYASIEDETIALTTRTTLNFTGTGVACADDTTKTTCTINAGAASAGGSDGQFQFNDGGSLGGAGGFVYNKSTGQIGVSTSTPFGAVQISTSTSPQLVLSDPNATVDKKHFYASSSQGSLVIGAVNDSLTTLTPRLTIDSTGNVGIGTSSPMATLTASSTSSTVATAVFDQRGTGGLLTLQSSGVDKFVVANNGGLTIKGVDNSVVRTTSNDFSQGTVGSDLNNENGTIELSDGAIPNASMGNITTGGPTLTSKINSGALAIARGDGKYLVLRGGGTNGIDIYDSVAGTFTASTQTTNGIIAGGAQAFPRPGGQYRITHGGTVTTTSLIDPMGSVPVGATVAMSAASATGTVAFLKPDGRYIFTNGGAATTQIYDPVADTFAAGPAFGATASKGALVIPVASSTTGYGALFVVGGTDVATTKIYVNSIGTTTIGSFSAGPDLGTGCEINGNGSVAIARPDGKYLVLSKANASTLYDPVLNAFTCRTSNGPATALGDGAHAIPLQNGTYLVIVGGGSTNSYIYNPFNDSFTAHNTALSSITVGALSILNQDGTWQILTGNGTGSNKLDTGLVMGGGNAVYTSDDISSSNLNTASTLRWIADLQAPMVGNINATSSIRFLVRTATNSGDCTTPLNSATDKELLNSNDFIRPATTDNCIRITVRFARPMPKKIMDDRGVFSGSGMTVFPLDYLSPSVSEIMIDNSSFLRKNNFDFNIANADIDAPQTIPGPTLNKAETSFDRVYLPTGRTTPTTMVGTTGYYAGSFSNAHPPLPQGNATTSTMVIARPNKTFMIIASMRTPAINAVIYDPSTQTFSSSTGSGAPTAANGLGGFALKRPDGKFLVVLGNFTPTTNIYDPVANTFTAGPDLSGNAGYGASAILNYDGTYTIMHGSDSLMVGQTTSSIYDPVRNTTGTMLAGPTMPQWWVGANCGFTAIPLTNGMYKVLPGVRTGATATTTTLNYNPKSKVFTTGTALTTTVAGCGSITFQREDGWWQIMAGETAGAGQLTTNLINPETGASSIGAPQTTSLFGRGGLIIPRADGTFLSINGNGLTTTNHIIPRGTGPAASPLSGVKEIGVTAVGPVMPGATGPGAVAFQRPDGKYVIINGNNTASTTVYDAGWYSDGQYISEQMQVPALSANATLGWKQSSDNYVSMEVRVANSQEALSTTTFKAIDKPSSSIFNDGGETWAQILINFRRDFPSWSGTMNDVYLSGAGLVYPYRKVSVPTVYSYYLNNGQDLLTLQTSGMNVLRVTSDGNIYSSANGGFFSGGADLAENYTSTDSLEPGDVVIIDSNNPHGVLKSPSNYQGVTLGVVSTAPGFVAGAYTKNAYPIGLIGRVPVKVSTENGNIKIGDYLTVSSVSGHAMKATLAGHVIGKALENLDTQKLTPCPEDVEGTTSRKCGTVMMFVNLVDYNGTSVDVAMEDWMLENNATTSMDVLSFLTNMKEVRANGNYAKSEIFTDRISAVSSIISPEIFSNLLSSKTIEGLTVSTENLNTKSININSPYSNVEGFAMSVVDGKLTITGNKIDTTDSNATSTDSATTTPVKPMITFDTNGNAFFAGEVRADKIVGNQIIGLEVISDRFAKLSDEVSGVASSSSALIASSSMSILEVLNKTLSANSTTVRELASTTSSLVATSTLFESRISALESVKPFDLKAMMATSSGLTFGGSLIVNGSLTVDSIGSASSSLSIMSDAQFFGTPYFTTDTAGFAIIKKGTKKVTVVFSKEYLEQPIVNTSISLNESTSTDQGASAVEAIFNQDIRFLITNKSKKGFTITLNKAVSEDVQFSWIALAVKGAKTFESEEIKTESQNVQNNTPITPIVNEIPKQEVNNNSTTTVSQSNSVSSTTPETTQQSNNSTQSQVNTVNTDNTNQQTSEQTSSDNTTPETTQVVDPAPSPVVTEPVSTSVETPTPAVIESAPAPVVTEPAPTPAETAPAPSPSENTTQ